MAVWITFWVCIGVVTVIVANPSEELLDYCENESFSASCPPDHMILISSAHYGRMSGSTCINNAHGCSLDVQKFLDQQCSGRPNCEVVVANLVPEEVQPCNRDYRSFLRASYQCVPVAGSAHTHCGAPNSMRILSDDGYLSSHVTQSSGAGSVDCPWTIEVGQGQTMRLTLLDFSSLTSDDSITNSNQCNVYATIKERSAGVSETVCGSSKRITTIYTSVTNQVEIRLVPRAREDNKAFMVRYQALGCPTPARPVHGYVRRTGLTAVVGCNYTRDTWEMSCTGSTWDIRPGNCSGAVVSASLQSGSGIDLSTINLKAALFLILSIAMPVSVTILVVGLVCIYKRRREHIRAVQAQLENGSVLYSPYAGGPPGKYPSSYSGHPNKRPYDVSAFTDNPTAGDATTSTTAYPSAENDYFHTWQRQHPNSGSTGNTDTYKYERAEREHIYESPQFKRRYPDNMDAVTSPGPVPPVEADGAVPLAYYYEIDPSTNNMPAPTNNSVRGNNMTAT